MIHPAKQTLTTYQSQSQQQETSPKNITNPFPVNHSDNKQQYKTNIHQQNPNLQTHNNISSLNCKEQLQSINSSQSNLSDEMDIDQQNDIVNDLSCVGNIGEVEEQDCILSSLSTKERILYANTKKHQGNQNFRENNLQQAIEAYKVGLSLLKPETFACACPQDCMLMAELTSNILYNMGTCYFILMSYRYAIKFYDQAILIKPNYAKAIHNRALCHWEQGDILQAYKDIKLAFFYDKNDFSIENDLEKIEEELHGTFSYQNLEKPNSHSDPSQTKFLSKSMIENNSGDFKLQNSDETATSLIKKEQRSKNILQIVQLSEKNPTSNTKQRVKSFYGKKFFPNKITQKLKKTNSFHSSMDSPKLRPYLTNKRLNIGNFSPQFSQKNKAKQDKIQRSTNNLFGKSRPIVLLEDKVEEFKQKNDELEEKDKSIRLRLKQKKAENKPENYWSYIPLFVATSYGLYHTFKTVLGK